jgi:hypothetical protein
MIAPPGVVWINRVCVYRVFVVVVVVIVSGLGLRLVLGRRSLWQLRQVVAASASAHWHVQCMPFLY